MSNAKFENGVSTTTVYCSTRLGNDYGGTMWFLLSYKKYIVGSVGG